MVNVQILPLLHVLSLLLVFMSEMMFILLQQKSIFGSGAAAKAIIYYITNYITKSQLKTHVALLLLSYLLKNLVNMILLKIN